jgi:hypothetical protein
MNNRGKPKYIPLLFAVLDGEDPNTWKPFDNKLFPELMADAQKGAMPYGVRDSLLQRYRVEIQPLLVGREALLEDNNLDKIVGVIIDALPSDMADEEDFFQRQLDSLLDLYRSQVVDGGSPLFKQFGYEIWFVTKDIKSPEIKKFVQSVRNAIAARLKGAAEIRCQYIIQEYLLSHQLNSYLGDAYYTLDEGPNL